MPDALPTWQQLPAYLNGRAAGAPMGDHPREVCSGTGAKAGPRLLFGLQHF